MAGMKTFGQNVKSEVRQVRDVFCDLVSRSAVPNWHGAQVCRTVSFDRRQRGFKNKPDAILLDTDGRVGVVECKRQASDEAKHGMIEQLLMYCEQARALDSADLIACIKAGRPVTNCPVPELSILDKDAAWGAPEKIVPILVVDRWGKRLHSTASFTLRFINGLLERADFPAIQVYAVGSGQVEVVQF